MSSYMGSYVRSHGGSDTLVDMVRSSYLEDRAWRNQQDVKVLEDYSDLMYYVWVVVITIGTMLMVGSAGVLLAGWLFGYFFS